jgi:hypothetical protein
MKFILGNIPYRKSWFYDGPKLIWELKVEHAGQFYRFDRLECRCGCREFCKEMNPVFSSKLRIFNSDDYPDDMIKHLAAQTQIVELIQTA